MRARGSRRRAPNAGASTPACCGASRIVSFDITGRRVLIIGASSGLGEVLAREFAEAGAIVTIVAEVPQIEAVARELSVGRDIPVTGILCDITDRAAVRALVGAVGPVDVLVNNAALTVETPVADDSERIARLFERTLAINVTGLYWVAQAVAASMEDGGRIIFTASLWGKTAGVGFSAYVASKHAMIGLVRTLAAELGPRGISVNAVCPHSIGTEANHRASADEVTRATATMWLHPGLLPPEDIAGMYVFLASPAASEITGQAFSVDRGAAIF
jgi:NAD(P)-dependent dehydrogenase (short-subunit alcohol dehydrogenase family)